MEVEFDLSSVKVGLSTLHLSIKTKTVYAAIYPPECAGKVSFDIDNSARAEVSEEPRAWIYMPDPDDDYMEVELEVTGLTETPAASPAGDAHLRALCDTDLEISSIPVIALIPKTQNHDIGDGGSSVRNFSAVGTTDTTLTSVLSVQVYITIFDQFGTELDPMFDSVTGGPHYVFEAFTDFHRTSVTISRPMRFPPVRP